ncbi:hypothetical protein ADL63_04255 [Enterococcus faecalis]|nr:hypothetical protein HMPREF9377_00129 [Enterococcus faecalis R712]EFQ08504.1 hypothetical protein HMPREF9492_03088 [Enterococcus faecalis DAPTO 512]EFQ66564.1 hypothetical protein HMPREF9493_02828 [Enterococcus faecalis DAPTO 516]ETJ10752.1 MAG: hypothetical protein Q608_EFC00031G0181 [Enterococcus faecalis DORA_14]RNA47683.1 hypothetical protein QP79_02385 [Enterococcus faecalis]
MGNIYLKIFKRKVQIVENFYIFKIIFLTIYICISVLLLFIINLTNSLLPIILINFLLLNYNLPKTELDLNQMTSYNYFYSNKVFMTYILFLSKKNNPLFSMFFLINFFNIILNIKNGFFMINILSAFCIQLIYFFMQLLVQRTYKILISICLIIMLLGLLFGKTLSISVLLLLLVLLLLVSMYFNIFTRKKFKSFNLKYVRNTAEIKMKKIFTHRNMYKQLFITYLNRVSIKEYFEYLFICYSLIVYSYFVDLIFDNIGLLIFFSLVDMELLSDKYFKNLNRTSSEFYFFKNSSVQKNKVYFLSSYFHKCLIFIMIGIISLIFSGNRKLAVLLVDFTYLTIVIFCISFLYYQLKNKGILTRKKENNFIVQYILFIFILLSLIGKSYIIKYLIESS